MSEYMTIEQMSDAIATRLEEQDDSAEYTVEVDGNSGGTYAAFVVRRDRDGYGDAETWMESDIYGSAIEAVGDLYSTIFPANRTCLAAHHTAAAMIQDLEDNAAKIGIVWYRLPDLAGQLAAGVPNLTPEQQAEIRCAVDELRSDLDRFTDRMAYIRRMIQGAI